MVKVKVFPKTKKEKFVECSDNSFEIYVREPAERNMANTRVRELIARHFGVELSKVVIRTGHRARGKTLAIIK